MGKRRRFSQEFKIEAVLMVVEQGREVVDVARELGIRPDMLRKWKNKFEQMTNDAWMMLQQHGLRLQ